VADVDPNAAILIAVGFFAAFSVKLGLFPFHFWLPTVYTGARPAVAAILSGGLANIGAYGMLRFGAELLTDELALASTALIVIGCASIVYGGVLAVSRRTSSEMLAYSAIGQVGYVLAAIGVGGQVGFAAAILYTVVNALNKILLFLTVEMRGAIVGAVFALGALSVAGVPPAAGFVGKLELFRAAVDSPAILALFVLGSALSFVYVFQIYQFDFWRGERTGVLSTRSQQSLVADEEAAGSDLVATSRALAKALEREQADLILFGQQSSDSDGAVLWAAVADRLRLPLISQAAELGIADGKATVKRQTEFGYDRIEAPLPAVVAVSDAINEPRYPSLKGIMGAKSKPQDAIGLTDIGLSADDVGEPGSRTEVLALGEPPARGESRKIEDNGSGAQQILDFLVEEKLL